MGDLIIRIPVRQPFDWAGVIAWFRPRLIPGIEWSGHLGAAPAYARTLALSGGPGVIELSCGEADAAVQVRAQSTDPQDGAEAVAVAERLVDAAADPAVIEPALMQVPELVPAVLARPGVRVPGTASLPEMVLRAIVGQQVSVASAVQQLGRMAQLCPPLAEELADGELALGRGLTRVFDPAVPAANQDWYRGPAARRASIAAGLAMVAELPMKAGQPRDQGDLRERLLTVRGIGPWTADYVALRCGHTDVVPPRDVALIRAARRIGLEGDLAELVSAARPWRSYAATHLWQLAAEG